MPTKADAKKNVRYSKNVLKTEVTAILEEYLLLKEPTKIVLFLKMLLQLKFYLSKTKFKQRLVLFIIVCLLILMIICSESFQWHLSALGRMALSRLLFYWNWKHLYTARCLISKESAQHQLSTIDKHTEFSADDCLLCEHLKNNGVRHVQNLQFHEFHDQYLLRGSPVVVKDSNNVWSKDEKSCIKLLQNIYKNVESKPCNLQTNLVSKKNTKLSKIFQIIESLMNESEKDNEGWFLQFRNCEFEAIKASRAISSKPYFYAALEQPHSSWLLISNNYIGKYTNTLNLIDLVIVQQLKGILEIILEAKNGCFEYCGDHTVTITEGQALVFMSRLWNFKYLPTNKSFSLSFITETYFD